MPFTPIESVAGGLAIGLAVFWNARLNGKVTGISGAFYNALMCDSLSLAFITGLITGGRVLKRAFTSDPLLSVPHQRVLLAGWLVGVGTSLANGCTSGHAVCGLSRLSRRSLVAVIVFFCVAVETAITFHSSGLFAASMKPTPFSVSQVALPETDEVILMGALLLSAVFLPLFLMILGQSIQKDKIGLVRESVLYAIGLVFSGGLIVSGMANPSKILSFLDLGTKSWDPSMAFVFLGALPLAFLGFRPLRHGGKPVLVASHSLPTNTNIDSRLVVGSILFGAGWGLIGLCPGPALVYFGAFPFSSKALGLCLAMACGSILSKAVIKRYDKLVS